MNANVRVTNLECGPGTQRHMKGPHTDCLLSLPGYKTYRYVQKTGDQSHAVQRKFGPPSRTILRKPPVAFPSFDTSGRSSNSVESEVSCFSKGVCERATAVESKQRSFEDFGGWAFSRLGAFGQVKGEHTSERLLSDVCLQAVKLTGLQGILGKVQPLDEAHKERADCSFEEALCMVSGF